MKLARLISQLGMGFITFCFITAAPAGIPIWSFAPVTGFPPTTMVSATGTATVKYTVSNNSSKAHKLVLKPQTGVSQNGSCILEHKGSSCTLLLTITGSALPASGLSGGPMLCLANPDGSPNPNVCYQPNKENSLKISISSAVDYVDYTVGGSVSGLSGTLVLTNNGGDAQTLTADGRFRFRALASESTYLVAVQSAPANQTCTVNNGIGTIGATDVTNVGVSCVTNAITLITSISDLALSVTGLTEYGITGTPSSGVARVITITNTGGSTAENLVVTSPAWPSGTSSTTTCGTSLAASSSCTMTVTPGSVPTSDSTTNPCSTFATEPVPGVINVTSSNASPVSINVTVLSYRCNYQGGYIYAFDDTTAPSRSVGGKVSTTVDQAAPYPVGVVWSSNGKSGHGIGGLDYTDVSQDTIPGIGETSTVSTGSPTYTTFTDFFSLTYPNNANPWTSSSFSTCIGNSNGSCNTGNILTFYNQFITNYDYYLTPPFTADAGPTNLADYAAGLCSGTISSHSDWYLPAICELSYDDPYSNDGCGTSDAPTLQSMQLSLVDYDYNNLNLLSGSYWSSTEQAADPQNFAWGHQFSPATTGYQIAGNKAYMFGIRCSRALTI